MIFTVLKPHRYVERDRIYLNCLKNAEKCFAYKASYVFYTTYGNYVPMCLKIVGNYRYGFKNHIGT
jgi:hypothetical protein